MILIGQYDSPFVRRIGIVLELYGMAFEHRPWSVFGDAERVRAVNPLGRVPVLVLADGTALVDSASMLDWLDEAAAAGGRAPLAPGCGMARVVALRRAALANGLAEKAVALVYETRFHAAPAPAVVARIGTQIGAVLDTLEVELGSGGRFWGGAAPGHADVALGCAAGFMAAAHPGLLRHARIAAHARACEALKVFARVRQDFVPPR